MSQAAFPVCRQEPAVCWELFGAQGPPAAAWNSWRPLSEPGAVLDTAVTPFCLLDTVELDAQHVDRLGLRGDARGGTALASPPRSRARYRQCRRALPHLKRLLSTRAGHDLVSTTRRGLVGRLGSSMLCGGFTRIALDSPLTASTPTPLTLPIQPVMCCAVLCDAVSFCTMCR